MAAHADWPSPPCVKFRLGSALVVLSEAEMRGLLARDLPLYSAALMRGKAARRSHLLDKRPDPSQGGGV
jgi:hypothetical protein